MNIKVQITTQENMEFYKCAKGAIIEVDFEQYIATVVASEIGTTNLEAAKAQAVAVRTYAIYKGVLNGKAISDSPAVAQAYRAPRYVSGEYTVCIQGTNETAGQILTYDGKAINAVFSACNGGRTYSAKEVWGGTKVYLVAQPDPWDAATGKKKNGHGVGMSQVGCKWAAKNGAKYREILAFYYPKTSLVENYGYKDSTNDVLKQIRDLIITAKEGL